MKIVVIVTLCCFALSLAQVYEPRSVPSPYYDDGDYGMNPPPFYYDDFDAPSRPEGEQGPPENDGHRPPRPQGDHSHSDEENDVPSRPESEQGPPENDEDRTPRPQGNHPPHPEGENGEGEGEQMPENEYSPLVSSNKIVSPKDNNGSYYPQGPPENSEDHPTRPEGEQGPPGNDGHRPPRPQGDHSYFDEENDAPTHPEGEQGPPENDEDRPPRPQGNHPYHDGEGDYSAPSRPEGE